ncbi:peptidase, T1 family [Onchocerca flexuosa]|uniref:Proteasome subunit alpha type n=2 Tax=Onchocerca flexuosa TaxID=387005 RepID=A0A238BYC3_9BILA|nr:peptidase, T1 family [Onchocerca flexuosa]
MFLTRSEYDRGVNTFSPEGRLFQVEYAIEAVKLGSTSIGIRTTEGVILAAEKRATSKLMVNDAIEKISKVDSHVSKRACFSAVTFAGLIADSRTLVERAQIEAQNFWFTYNRKIRVEDVTMSVANLALQFGDDDAKASMSRPFGVAMLFAGVDQDGPRLFHLDPSGTFIDCLAKSIGAASDGAEQSLKEQYHESMSLVEAEKVALSILKQVMEEKLTSSNVEIVAITPVKDSKGRLTGKFERLSKERLDTLVAEL